MKEAAGLSRRRASAAQIFSQVVSGLTPPKTGFNRTAAGQVRLRTLITIRWLAVAGQTLAVFFVQLGLGFNLMLVPCLAVIGASVVFNMIQTLRHPATRRLSMREATLHSAFDIVQIAILLALTGGLANPFVLLLLAPITVAATLLSLRATIQLGVLGFLLISGMTFLHGPLPWRGDTPLLLPPMYIWGIWVAMSLGILFNSTYAWWVSAEANRMQTALAATQQVLSREQRLAALGGLAAAAAHELGTPLATIALVAKEMSRDMKVQGPHAEDVALLRDQAERCREILSRLSRAPGEGDAVFVETPLGALLDSIAAPHRDMGIRVSVTVDGPVQGEEEPRILRRPEIEYGLGNFVENAVDFARAQVHIKAHWSKDRITVRIVDDGPGFAPDIIDRLGEPYVTTRAPSDEGAAEDGAGDAEGQHGMGLGFFIAKTLLERTGAQLSITNRSVGSEPAGRGGAQVTVVWPFERIALTGPSLMEKEAGRART